MAEDSLVSSSMDKPVPGMVGAGERHSLPEAQEEGVLMDILQELDKERNQRAELQAKIRELEQQGLPRQNSSAGHPRSTGSITTGGITATNSGNTYLALKAERDGYLELVEALTQGRPAFSKQQTLPLHVVRLLEVVPWDPRARQHFFGEEELWEWQILGADKTWQARLRFFPTIFKMLPVVVPQPGKTVGEAPTSSSPPKQCVLTNLQVTHILNVDKGYPLPQDGGDWVWVGGWRIEKHPDADEEGWSYSNDLNLTLDSSYYGEFRPPQRGTPNLVKRRRKWTRTRVLVDYPQASAMTKEYLKLVAEKASLDVSATKLSSQLVETKMNLTKLEADHLTLKEETSRIIASLERELDEKNKLLEMIQQHDGLDADSMTNLVSKKAQVKELRSAVTAWVNSAVSKRHVSGIGSGGEIMASEDLNGHDEGATVDATPSRVPSKDNSDVAHVVLSSLKGKGTDFFEKFKQKGGEELEKMKQNKGLTSWTTTSSTKQSTRGDTEQLPITESVTEETMVTEA